MNQRENRAEQYKGLFAGGLICVFGQALQLFFRTYFQFDEITAGNPTSAVLIMISVLLTGLGVYDHIAQWAGAGPQCRLQDLRTR